MDKDIKKCCHYIVNITMTIDSINTRKDVADDLSRTLGTEVAPAIDADPEYGDTVLYVENDGEVQAYVAEGSVQRPDVGNIDYDVENWGSLQESSNVAASGNQYPGEVADKEADSLGSDTAFMGTETQGRNETTDVSLEPGERKAGAGFIRRALSQDQEV